MKIAIISTAILPAKPYRLFSGYGGLEKLCGTWAEEIAKRGHEVTLLGAPGSYAEGVKVVPLQPGVAEEENFNKYRDSLDEYDIVMDNTWQHWPAMAWGEGPRPPGQLVIFHHGVLGDIGTPPPIERPSWICASVAQANYISNKLGIQTRVVHHGVDTEVFSPGSNGNREDYFLMVTRLSPEKGVLPTLQLLKQEKKRVVIIADSKLIATPDYVKRVLAECDGYMVRFIEGSNLTLEAQVNWMRSARALVHTPLDPWIEIGALSVIESLACGVPVLGTRNGALLDIVVHGENGFLADTPDGLVEYFQKVDELEPSACRRRIEGRFDLATNADALLATMELARETGGW